MFFENSTSGLAKLIFFRTETPRTENLKPFSENHKSLTWKTKPWREDNIQTNRQKVFLYVIEMYDPITTHNLFTFDTNITWGHNLKLKKVSFKTNKFKHFFTNRVVNLWNSLPEEVVYASSLNVFKNRLDYTLHYYKFLTNIDIWNISEFRTHRQWSPDDMS